MAELIDKGAFLKEIESIKFLEDAKKMKVSDAEMDGFFRGMVEGILYFVPTTTESEIRAKAHQEFYDKVLNFEDYILPYAEENGVQLYSGRDITYMVRKIAEQLKERE